MRRVRASTICRALDRLLVVRLRDPSTGVDAMFPPGGAVEAGETPVETAVRETLEETGLRVLVDASSERVETYPYRWDGKDYDVTTSFFMAALAGPIPADLPVVVDASYNLGASWMPVSDALDAMPRRIALIVAAMVRRQNHETWGHHPNIGGPAGTLLGIHSQFRHAARRILELLEQVEPSSLEHVGRAFAPFAETLHHHHHAEEVMLFPVVEMRSGVAPARLVGDHGVLVEAIETLERRLVRDGDVAGAKLAATSFEYVLTLHLDREEELVVPLLLALSAQEAWSLIHG